MSPVVSGVDVDQAHRSQRWHIDGMSTRFLLTLSLCATLGGCASLLPRGSSDTPSTFASFEQAEAAALKITAFSTRVSELKALGFDPQEGRNVTRIPYPDIVGRLAPHPGVPLDSLDPGIRQCILAQSSCHAYLLHFERQEHHREGSFWSDFFNIRRVTYVKGWWFDALVVVSNGTVLFRNVAGQAHTDRVDRQTNPLGPFQPAGESAGSALIR